MSHSPHKILIDLDEYNEIIALNITYKKFLYKLSQTGMVYAIDIESSFNGQIDDYEYEAVLWIYAIDNSKHSGFSLSWSLENYQVGDNYSSQLAEMFDRGLDYLETLK